LDADGWARISSDEIEAEHAEDSKALLRYRRRPYISQTVRCEAAMSALPRERACYPMT
jgi:hypothetical protein